MAEITLKSLEALEQEIVRKRDAKIVAAENEANRALGALKIVAEMLKQDIEPVADVGLFETASQTTTAPATESTDRKAHPTSKWVADIINELNGAIISQPIVYDRLRAKHPEIRGREPNSVKGQVAMILKKMAQHGDLIEHKKGYGSEPTEYRRRTVMQQSPIMVIAPTEENVAGG